MPVTSWPTMVAGDDWSRRERGRTRELIGAWGEFLGAMRWQSFVTATFDPSKVFPVSRIVASREAFWWCGQVGRLLRRPLAWVYATERGRGGQWHAHLLFIGADAVELAEPAVMWNCRNGLIDCRPVYDTHGVALYTSKQAAMDGEIVWSDTLAHYRTHIAQAEIVALYPGSSEMNVSR